MSSHQRAFDVKATLFQVAEVNTACITKKNKQPKKTKTNELFVMCQHLASGRIIKYGYCFHQNSSAKAVLKRELDSSERLRKDEADFKMSGRG